MEPGKYDKHSGFNLQLLKVLNKRYEASAKIRLVAGRWDVELDTGLTAGFPEGTLSISALPDKTRQLKNCHGCIAAR
jgi:hypothetical protein